MAGTSQISKKDPPTVRISPSGSRGCTPNETGSGSTSHTGPCTVQSIRRRSLSNPISLGHDPSRGALKRLTRDRDRGVRAVRYHVDVVGLHDESRVRVALLLQNNLGKLRIVARSLEPPVALFFRWVPAHIDEGILSADAELGVALLRDPVADVRTSMSRVNGGRAVGKSSRQRVSLARLRGVDTQLIETNRVSLLRESPTHPDQAERDSDEGGQFPFQHDELLRLGNHLIARCGQLLYKASKFSCRHQPSAVRAKSHRAALKGLRYIGVKRD